MNSRRVVATIEARMAASRLPGKVMLPLASEPMLARIVERARRADTVDDVVVATTVHPADRVIADFCERSKIAVHRGPVEDISRRICDAASSASIIVQLTGDCPLIDPEHIDRTVGLLLDAGADYASNSLDGCTFPIGFDVRAFTKDALERSMVLSDDPIDRVHGSYFIARRRDLFKVAGWDAPPDLAHTGMRLTVDEPADYELVRRIFDTLHPADPNFGAAQIIALVKSKPDWAALNNGVQQKLPSDG